MRLCSIVVSLMMLSSLIGCGGSNKTLPLNQMSNTTTNLLPRKVAERSWPSSRAADEICTITGANLSPDQKYLAVAQYEDQTVRVLPAVAPDSSQVLVDISTIDPASQPIPVKVAVYQLNLPTADPQVTAFATRSAGGRAVRDDRNCVILHGQWSDADAMRTIAQTVADTNIFRGVYTLQYDWGRSIPKEAATIKLMLGHSQYGSFTGDKRLVIIGHSQGGIEARYLIEKLGMSGDVETLVMLGTPNNGAAGFNVVTAQRVDLAFLITQIVGVPLAPEVIFTVDAAATLADAPVRQLSEGSTFLADLNQPSGHKDVTYVTIAGDVGNGSDRLVKVSSCHYWQLDGEATWFALPTLTGIDHSGLRWRAESMNALTNQLKRLYPDAPTAVTYAYIGNSTSSSSTSSTSTSGSGTSTTTQPVLTHPASRWDYGETGFWYGEGKWHAAAKRVDVGPPLEKVQMDGRDGTIRSGVSGRGFSLQHCQNGILVNLGTDVFAIKGEFYEHYLKAGGPQGELGCLTTEQRYDQKSGVSGGNGEWAQFEGGFIAKFDGLTATVLGDFGRVWNTKGKGQGELGYPKDYRRSVKSGAPQFVNITGGWGQYQPFEGGCIAEWSQTEHVITGGFNREYLRTGGPGGPLGYPQTAKRTGVRSGCSARYGEEQLFQFGRICELGVNNAWAVYGEILKRYSGPEYRHGFPKGQSINDNHSQPFEELTISW